MRKIEIPIPGKEYNVLILEGILNRVDEFLDVNGQFVVITDSNVEPLYLSTLSSKLLNCKTYIVNPGENSKSMETAYSLINQMIEDGVTRDVSVVALGGGVVGDLAGFIASIYMRGVKFIQIPTTLLSQIDSCVGGKVGINSKSMKNSIGSFYQPSIVLIDPLVLKTLSKRELNNGFAEMIKYGMISSKPLIEALENGINISDVSPYIEQCLLIKKALVLQDEFDHGVRQLLNYGHTIGHALEQDSKYSLLHGEAISIGMAKISQNEDYYQRLVSLLHKYGLPTVYEYNKQDVYNYITTDKKVKGNILNIIRVKTLGKALVEPMEKIEIKEYL